MELKGKNVVITGFGKTGIACADFLLKYGANITITDIKKKNEFESELIARYEMEKIKFVFGEHPAELFLNTDLILISPGIDTRTLPIADIRKKGIPIISEIELASRFAKGKIIGVTGTNGKTTVTTLLGEIFKNAGYSTVVCGNIGYPFIKAVGENPYYDYFIVEISSFQLEAVNHFRAHGGILLNISPDHMDRYETQEDYLRAKWNLFMNQQNNDWAVLNDMQINKYCNMPAIHSAVWKFSSLRQVQRGCYLHNNAIYYSEGADSVPVIEVQKIKLKGMHNIENVMVCIIAAKQENLNDKIVVNVISNFQGLPHRMEPVGIKNGVIFINDSKATNPDAVVKALEGFQKNVIVILGGKDKDLDYGDLKDAVQKHVKIALLIGETKHKIFDAIKENDAEILFADSMEDAVKKAYASSQHGDVILLSPACASFDMFKDYVDRGNTFKKIVESIVEGKDTKALKQRG